MTCPDWRRLDPAARDACGAPHAVHDPSGAAGAVRWQEALSHLDSGCPRCWQEALAVDPTLIFRRLPAPELGPSREAEEVEAARAAVAAMRTASRLEGGSRGARGPGNPGNPGRPVSWWRAGRGFRENRGGRPMHSLLPSLPTAHAARWALAAGLTAMALVYGSGHGWHPVAAPGPAAVAGAVLAAGPLPAAETFGDPSIQASRAIRAGSAFAATTQGMPGPSWAAAPASQPAASRPSIEGLSRPEARVYQIDSPHMSVVMIVDDKLDV